MAKASILLRQGLAGTAVRVGVADKSEAGYLTVESPQDELIPADGRRVGTTDHGQIPLRKIRYQLPRYPRGI